MNWATRQPAGTRCAGRSTQGAVALLAWGLETFPTTWNGGICSCRPVGGTSTPSVHGECRAVDLMFPTVFGRANLQGHVLVRRLGEHGRRLGIQCIIFDRRIWTAKNPNGVAYTGQHPHLDHAHIELTHKAARDLTLTTIRNTLNPAPPKPGDPSMHQTISRGPGWLRINETIQRHLNTWRTNSPNQNATWHPLAVDGIFGAGTEAAVKDCQRVHGLSPTGVVDGVTMALLRGML